MFWSVVIKKSMMVHVTFEMTEIPAWFLVFRLDQTLQNIVYKLVPGLFQGKYRLSSCRECLNLE